MNKRHLLLLVTAVGLGLGGCGETRLSDQDVDRIAARTLALMKPEVEAAIAQSEARVLARLARAPAAAATPAKLPPPAPLPGTTPAATPTPQTLERPTSPPVATKAPAPTPSAPPASPPSDDQDPVLARIGDDEVIRASDVRRLRAQNPRIAQLPVRRSLEELAQFRLMAGAAIEAGFPGRDPEVARNISERVQEFRYEYMIRHSLEKQPAITDQDLRLHYTKNEDEYTTRAQMEIWEIVTPDEAQARQALSEVEGDNFAAVAKARSKSPTAFRGGALGKVSKERVTKEAWDALVEAEEGALVGPFRLAGGQAAIYKRGSYTPGKRREFDEVKAQLKTAVESERRNQVVDALVTKARKIWPLKVEIENPGDAKAPEDLLATIGAVRITKADFDSTWKNTNPQRIRSFLGPKGKQLFLDVLVKRILISNLAQTDTEFRKDHEPAIQDVRRQLLINAYAEAELYPKVEVDDAKARQFYDANKSRFRSPPNQSIKARHILVRVGQDADEDTVSAAKAKIDAALARIQAGEDFADVAKDASEGPTGPRGGDLGAFGPGRMVPPFDQAVQALKPWQVTQEPVRTRFGFHLIRREPSPEFIDFEKVRPSIKQQLTSQGRSAVILERLRELRAEHPVTFLDDQVDPARLETLVGALEKPEADPHAGHDHGSHAGHDHGSHAGHDHGSHAGHDHGTPPPPPGTKRVQKTMTLKLKDGKLVPADSN